MAELPCSEGLGLLLVTGAPKNSTKQVKASLRMPLPGPPASSSCPASSPRLCTFQEGPHFSVVQECAGCNTGRQMPELGGKHLTTWPTGSHTWVSGLGFQGCLPVAVLKKGTETLSEGEDINNNNINNNGQVPRAVLSALPTFVRLASRAEVSVNLNPGPTPTNPKR